MREILFRGKSLDTMGCWVEGSLIHRTEFYGDPCDDYFILYGGEFDCDYYEADRVDPKTVGQFTGLIDKNGKKIFEGDIISFENMCWSVGFDLTGFCAMDGKKMQFQLFEQYIWNYKTGSYDAPDYFEVIGNIHDNPELLEVEDGN